MILIVNHVGPTKGFLRASAAMLMHVLDIPMSVCLSVRPSVCHTVVLYQNG